MATPPMLNGKTYLEKAMTLLLLFLLLYLSYTVIGVFLGVFTYAIILTVSFNSLFEKIVRGARGKRSLIAFIYAVLAILLIALPFIYIVNSVGNYIHSAQVWVENAKQNGIPPIPTWVDKLPKVLQTKVSAFWATMSADPAGTIGLYDDQIKGFFRKMISGGLGIAGAGFEIILGIIVSAILLTKGEKALDPLLTISKKLIGEKSGPALLNSAGRAIQGVSIGVIGTATIAAVVAWIGFTIEGLSTTSALTALIFFLVLIQVGPILVVVPLGIYQFTNGDTTAGMITVVFGIILLVIDNVVKPILIGKSGKLPILVLFLGVIGGMTAWGFTGMFKGAIIMAIFYTLMQSWNTHENAIENAEVTGLIPGEARGN
jgi:predicted PurR-regulated permease PerM